MYRGRNLDSIRGGTMNAVEAERTRLAAMGVLR
jgi:hypothetical protein